MCVAKYANRDCIYVWFEHISVWCASVCVLFHSAILHLLSLLSGALRNHRSGNSNNRSPLSLKCRQHTHTRSVGVIEMYKIAIHCSIEMRIARKKVRPLAVCVSASVDKCAEYNYPCGINTRAPPVNYEPNRGRPTESFTHHNYRYFVHICTERHWEARRPRFHLHTAREKTLSTGASPRMRSHYIYVKYISYLYPPALTPPSSTTPRRACAGSFSCQ